MLCSGVAGTTCQVILFRHTRPGDDDGEIIAIQEFTASARAIRILEQRLEARVVAQGIPRGIEAKPGDAELARDRKHPLQAVDGCLRLAHPREDPGVVDNAIAPAPRLA